MNAAGSAMKMVRLNAILRVLMVHPRREKMPNFGNSFLYMRKVCASFRGLVQATARVICYMNPKRVFLQM
jgi:hypothetical protein